MTRLLFSSLCSQAGLSDAIVIAGAAAGTTGRVRAVLYDLSEQFKQRHQHRSQTAGPGAFDAASQPEGAHLCGT